MIASDVTRDVACARGDDYRKTKRRLDCVILGVRPEHTHCRIKPALIF